MCVCRSLPFSLTGVDSWNQHCNQDTELFHHHKGHLLYLLPLKYHAPPSLPTLRLSLICFPSRESCHFQSVPPTGLVGMESPFRDWAEKRTDECGGLGQK